LCVCRSKTFLHEDLDNDIYMTQLEGFQMIPKKSPKCKLKKKQLWIGMSI